MPNGFNQMGNIPEGYDSLLNAARQQLVRMPDGTLQLAPQFGGSTSLDAIYGGILPSTPPAVPGPLKTRSVPTYDVDASGNPIIAQAPGFTADKMSDTRTEQAGIRPAITVGTQPAGTVTMPPGARPAVVDQMMAQVTRPPVPQPGMFGRGQPATWDPFNPNRPKFADRLPSNDGGEAGFLAAFGPEAAVSPPIAAINNAVPVPLPRVRPIPPAQTPLTAVAPPRATAVPPTIPGAITFKRGDTVSALAKRLGMTTASFADRYGISNPNKIRAGDTVVPQAPVMPRMPPAGLMRSPPQVPMPRTPTAAMNRGRQIAEGKASQLDEFGMIR